MRRGFASIVGLYVPRARLQLRIGQSGVVRKSLHHSAPPKPKTTQVPRRFQAPGLARRLEPFMMFGANSPTFCGWLIALCVPRPTDLLQILNLDLFNSHE